MCKYYGLLTPSPSRESLTDPMTLFVEVISYWVINIPHLDITIIVSAQHRLHFSWTPFHIVRGWSDTEAHCHWWLVCQCKHWQFFVELLQCFKPVRYQSPMDLRQVRPTPSSSAIPSVPKVRSYFCHISDTPPFVPVPLVSPFIPMFPVSLISVSMSLWSSRLSHSFSPLFLSSLVSC